MNLANSLASHRAEKEKYLIAAKRYFTSLALRENSKQMEKPCYSHNFLPTCLETIDKALADPLFTSEPRQALKSYFLYLDDPYGREEKGKFVLSFVNTFIKFIEKPRDNNFIQFPLVK